MIQWLLYNFHCIYNNIPSEHKLIQNLNEKRPSQSKHITRNYWREINPAIFETTIVKWMDKFSRSAITKVQSTTLQRNLPYIFLIVCRAPLLQSWVPSLWRVLSLGSYCSLGAFDPSNHSGTVLWVRFLHDRSRNEWIFVQKSSITSILRPWIFCIIILLLLNIFYFSWLIIWKISYWVLFEVKINMKLVK